MKDNKSLLYLQENSAAYSMSMSSIENAFKVRDQ